MKRRKLIIRLSERLQQECVATISAEFPVERNLNDDIQKRQESLFERERKE